MLAATAVIASCSNHQNKNTSAADNTGAVSNNTDTTAENNTQHQLADTVANKSVKLEQVFADSTYQLTGVAISKNGRLFTDYPLWAGPHQYSLVEVFPGNKVKPYPDVAMNNWKKGDDGQNKWVCVQAVYIDNDNVMWVIDPAAPKLGKVYQQSYKLVRINLNTNKVERTYGFAGGPVDEHSYLNDVRVDTKKQIAYITNSGTGGIVVVDLKSGKVRQLLQNHYSVHTNKDFKFMIDGHEMKQDGQPVKFDSDGIALTPDGGYLYYKPLTDTKLYRIKTAALLNDTLSGQKLKGYVEDLGKFVVTDGMIFDKKGNLYLGDVQNSSIVKISPDLKMTTVIKDPRLIWPDSYSISDDGYLYVSCSQIQKTPDHNAGVNKRTSPYSIYRLKLPE